MIDQKKAKEAYGKYLEKARTDDRIIGVVLAGGRGKGAATKNSDYDVFFITTDEGLEGVVKDYPDTEFVDSLPRSISQFRRHAEIGSPTEYDKYSFTHLKSVIDKTGEIQKLVDKKGSLTPDIAFKIARNALGGYLNQVHRSMKYLRDKNELAARLDASESIPLLITFLFSVENRVKPYNKFLEWELQNYPLNNLPISKKQFIGKIKRIIDKGDAKSQKDLYGIVVDIANKNGHSDEIKDWSGYFLDNYIKKEKTTKNPA